MAKRIDVETILKKNPHIKPEDLKALESLTQALRDAGLVPREYGLLSPDERSVPETEEEDPRTVRLSNYIR